MNEQCVCAQVWALWRQFADQLHDALQGLDRSASESLDPGNFTSQGGSEGIAGWGVNPGFILILGVLLLRFYSLNRVRHGDESGTKESSSGPEPPALDPNDMD